MQWLHPYLHVVCSMYECIVQDECCVTPEGIQYMHVPVVDRTHMCTAAVHVPHTCVRVLLVLYHMNVLPGSIQF